jgi:hypothetical protein
MATPRSSIIEIPRRIIHWLCSGREDYREFERRKRERRYRSGRALCVWVWLGAALIMLLCPGINCVITILLVATFLSFAILDND